jgi:hypothetical protein
MICEQGSCRGVDGCEPAGDCQPVAPPGHGGIPGPETPRLPPRPGGTSPREQASLLQLLIERVDYDGAAKEVAITFRPAGLASLCADAQRSVA